MELEKNDAYRNYCKQVSKSQELPKYMDINHEESFYKFETFNTLFKSRGELNNAVKNTTWKTHTNVKTVTKCMQGKVVYLFI